MIKIETYEQFFDYCYEQMAIADDCSACELRKLGLCLTGDMDNFFDRVLIYNRKQKLEKLLK